VIRPVTMKGPKMTPMTHGPAGLRKVFGRTAGEEGHTVGDAKEVKEVRHKAASNRKEL